LTPSVFVHCTAGQGTPMAEAGSFFRCLKCGGTHLVESPQFLECQACGQRWAIHGGIYDFRGE
jgi:hypothetical protein